MKTIYLGNLPVAASEDDVRELFGQHGDVDNVLLIIDRETGQSRGFGFVEMEPEAADRAIAALDGADYRGRTLRVNEARNRGAKPPRRSW
ncbi:MAG: RNA-binding protein [Candidatus Krumholzibacteriota bacterium]